MNSKPLITIIMAIYKPNIIWLQEQLISLNEQDYPCLKLLVWNDCPEDETNYEVIFSKCITKFPYKIIRGKKNLGSNGAFEQLTVKADGEYLAYCDQDDIWHSNKLSVLMDLLLAKNGTLACSDMAVINGNGDKVAVTIQDVRPRHVFVEGNSQVEYLITRNFVTGCTMIVKNDIAKKAVPFPAYEEMVHDHWLALWNAINGKIVIAKIPLIDYRIHGNNQTSVLTGITSKKTYYDIRIIPYFKRIAWLLEKNFPIEIKKMLERRQLWAKARCEYQKNANAKNFIKVFKGINFNICATAFELAMPFMSNSMFNLLIRWLRK